MPDTAHRSVSNTLAAYFEVAPSEIRPEHDLLRDWGLAGLELHLVATLIEEQEDIEIRPEDLRVVHSVAQLIRLVRALHTRRDYEQRIAAAHSSDTPLTT